MIHRNNPDRRQAPKRYPSSDASRPARTSGRHPSHGRPNARPHTPVRAGGPARTGRRTGAKMRMSRKNMPRLTPKKKEDVIPALGDNIRIIPLGGVEEVGKNMIVVEYKDDIVIFDMGFQFVTEEETPGIDYILPNTKYLEQWKEKIRGVVITHGHLDHIGGIPYIMNRIGNPKIYTHSLTKMMIGKRQSEFPHLPELDIREVEPGDNIKLGNLPIKFYPISHSIPDAMAVSLETPYGNIVITGDLKLDHIDNEPTSEEKKVWGEIGKHSNLLLVSDSTNVENPGFSITEKKIQENLEEIIKNVPGRPQTPNYH